MRQVELGPRISNDKREQLLNELNRAVDKVGKYEVFKPGQTGKIKEEARNVAYEFAVVYGNCILAGMEMEVAPYDPADMSVNVVWAATNMIHREAQKLQKLVQDFGWFKRNTQAQEIFKTISGL